MNVTDPIADMLTRIRNANRAGRENVELPHSNLKEQIARILKQEGYIADYHSESRGKSAKTLRLQLKVIGKQRAITGLRRISKPGVRRYVQAAEIPPVLGGMGIAILSTSRGVMTGREAKKAGVGGELLCYVW
jgi:small subunit ribosomal protein S8